MCITTGIFYVNGIIYGARTTQVLLIWQLFTYLLMDFFFFSSGYNLHNEGFLYMLLLI